MEYLIIGAFIAIVVISLFFYKRSKSKKGINVNHPQGGGKGRKPNKIENK